MSKMWNLLRNKVGTKRLICGILGICIAIVWLVSLTAWRAALVDLKCYKAQNGIADEVFRFHVLANSDSGQDQNIKLAVRDEVLSYMRAEMPENEGAKQTERWIEAHLDELIRAADEVLEKKGADYTAQAEVTRCYFPEKRYGDVTFPEGNYDALRITLGKAEGHNWWCVLYPNLCFLDTTYAVVSDDGKEELEDVLTDDEYQMITDDKELKVKWFFFGD